MPEDLTILLLCIIRRHRDHRNRRRLALSRPHQQRLQNIHQHVQAARLETRVLCKREAPGVTPGHPLRDAAERLDGALKEVRAVEVAVVVDKEVENGLGVREGGLEGLEDGDPLVEGGVAQVERAEDDEWEEDADLGLEVVPEAEQEDCRKNGRVRETGEEKRDVQRGLV